MLHSISKESRAFLENLRLYLLSSGKKETEINEVVDELEVHLTEAEANGKSVKHIIGHSPGEYMQQIANEMPKQKGQWIAFIMLSTIGVIAYDFIMSAIAGEFSYSLLKVLGTVGIVLIFTLLLTVTFKSIATKEMSKSKEYTIYILSGFLPLFLFIGLIYLDRSISTPVIHFGTTGTWLVVSSALFFLIIMSIWAKTWSVLVILFFLALPELIFGLFEVHDGSRLVLPTIISFGGIVLYLYMLNRKLSK